MIKKDKEKKATQGEEPKEVPPSDDILAQLTSTLQTIARNQQDLNDRLDDIEKKTGDGAAKLLIAERLFNTDDDHLPELTVMPLRAVRAYSRAIALSEILSDESQIGGKSQSTYRRIAIFKLMRSVKGNWGEKGMRLAEQQAEAEGEKGEEFHSGQGLV